MLTLDYNSLCSEYHALIRAEPSFQDRSEPKMTATVDEVLAAYFTSEIGTISEMYNSLLTKACAEGEKDKFQQYKTTYANGRSWIQ